MTQEQAKKKINEASRGCEKAEKFWRDAATAINGSVSTNGYGIHHDRYQLRNKLLDAEENIKKGLAALNEIDWPTEAEYNLAD